MSNIFLRHCIAIAASGYHIDNSKIFSANFIKSQKHSSNEVVRPLSLGKLVLSPRASVTTFAG